MSTVVAIFQGFSPTSPRFLGELRANNTREWFHAHRAAYEELLLEPARALVEAMAEPLHTLGPDIHAEPRVHGSILAINRDTRFSPDKTPYKTHLDLWFWQGDGPNRERPGYFFRLTPESLMLGAGMHAFSADGQLERYRQAVLDPERGVALERAAAEVGPESIGGRTYSRVPRGLPAEHPRSDWLRHSGLFAEETLELPPQLTSPEFPDFCLARFARFRPLQQWLVELRPA